MQSAAYQDGYIFLEIEYQNKTRQQLRDHGSAARAGYEVDNQQKKEWEGMDNTFLLFNNFT